MAILAMQQTFTNKEVASMKLKRRDILRSQFWIRQAANVYQNILEHTGQGLTEGASVQSTKCSFKDLHLMHE
ncbi:MAG: hypothetical protein MZV64_37685 [Ignavibacteriales bacterium]|nr:hypothetical protein [Ignavibacteriales bacterium]